MASRLPHRQPLQLQREESRSGIGGVEEHLQGFAERLQDAQPMQPRWSPSPRFRPAGDEGAVLRAQTQAGGRIPRRERRQVMLALTHAATMKGEARKPTRAVPEAAQAHVTAQAEGQVAGPPMPVVDIARSAAATRQWPHIMAGYKDLGLFLVFLATFRGWCTCRTARRRPLRRLPKSRPESSVPTPSSRSPPCILPPTPYTRHTSPCILGHGLASLIPF